jgi:hypothetical protein
MIALVSADLASDERLWDEPVFLVAFGASVAVFFAGAGALANYFLGWPPVAARPDALQELLDELERNRRDLQIQLANGRTFGILHLATAWTKNEHVLDAPKHDATRDLVRDAYEKTQALNERTNERFAPSSAEGAHDPLWLALTDDEVKQRTEALEAVGKAQAAVAEIRNAEIEPA